jgi:hypothetical protein
MYRVGADRIAGTGSRGDEHAVTAIVCDDVARATGRSSEDVGQSTVDLDAMAGIRYRTAAAGCRPDVVALNDVGGGRSPDDLDPIDVVPGDEITRTRCGPTDLNSTDAFDAHAGT